MPLDYPKPHKVSVQDGYHGTPVADPYRWLEDPTSPETRAFIQAQNRLTQAYLEGTPNRQRWEKRLQELWNFPKFSTPRKANGRFFFSKNDGLQNQPVIYQQTEGQAPSLLLDPNPLSPDGTIAVMGQSYSPDGTLLAYSLSQSGSDRQVVKLLNTQTGETLPDEIHWCRFTNVSWDYRGFQGRPGFYYNRYPQPGTVPPEDQTNFSQVYWHSLGTSQAEDILIYEDPLNKHLSFSPIVTDDGAYLVIYAFLGTSENNGLYIRSLRQTSPQQNGEFLRLVEHGEAAFSPVGNRGSVFYLNTDLNAPNGRIVAVDITRPERTHWQEIVSEEEHAIHQAMLIHDYFVVVRKVHAAHRLYLYSLEGKLLKEIALPTIGSIFELWGKQSLAAFFITFHSFLYPTTIFQCDLAGTAELEPVLFGPSAQAALPFDLDSFETTQVFYPGKDGTQIPMFLTGRKGLERNGKTPTILYAYGGFNLAQTPSFMLQKLAWIEQGGLFALANIRGGSEYGEAWHEAGMLQNKQTVFDDFIAAAEWLIEQGYTSTPHLAIEGRSNGGLLTGACMVQRPDLYGAVLCHVGVLDMLRYHKFTVGRYWIPEYGNAEVNPEHFKFLYAYSPLHNLKEGEWYPPILITTADTDDRVVPMHSLKFAAALQEKSGSTAPHLLRVETSAGHGLGKPTRKVIEELVDVFCFLERTIMNPQEP